MKRKGMLFLMGGLFFLLVSLTNVYAEVITERSTTTTFLLGLIPIFHTCHYQTLRVKEVLSYKCGMVKVDAGSVYYVPSCNLVVCPACESVICCTNVVDK
jgi:hypothetical protein